MEIGLLCLQGFGGGAEGAWMEILTKECIYDPCAFLYVYTE